MKRLRSALCLTLTFALILGLPPATSFAADGEFIRYTVKKGDTLSKIAGQHLSNSTLYPELLKYNDIKDANWIYPGDVIVIPKEDVLRKLSTAADEKERQKILTEAGAATVVDTSFRQAVKESGKCDDPNCPRCYPKEGGVSLVSGGSGNCAVRSYEDMDEEEMKAAALKTRELDSRIKYAPIKAHDRRAPFTGADKE